MSIVKLEPIKAIAQQHGIKAGRMKKSDLVRAIQKNTEGNEQCLRRADPRHAVRLAAAGVKYVRSALSARIVKGEKLWGGFFM